MAITINGNGTITGLSTGGLPDGSVDADTLASGTVLSWTTTSASNANGNSNVDISGIPSTAVIVVVHFVGLSTASDSSIYFRVGTSSGFIDSGDYYDYSSFGRTQAGTEGTDQNDNKIRLFRADSDDASVRHGQLTLLKASGNYWTFNHTGGHDGNQSGYSASSGAIEVGAALTQVRTICNSGNFDAGSIYLSYLG